MRAKAKRKTSRPARRVSRKPASSTRRASAPRTTSLKWNPRVACRTLDGTAFILLNSRMLRLNEVGTYIWERFEDGSTVDQVVEGIVSEFETTPKRATVDAQAFVKQLLTKEVLVPVSARSQTGRSL